MAAHTATVSSDGDDTVIRIAGHVRLPLGPALVKEVEATGELVLAPVGAPLQPYSWDELFQCFDAQPRDEYWSEFMRVMQARPMNRLPVDRDIFGGK